MGIKTISDGALEKLRTAKRRKYFIKDTINYDILQNKNYADQFVYSVQSVGKDQDHVSCNLVASLIYLGEKRLETADYNHHSDHVESLKK